MDKNRNIFIQKAENTHVASMYGIVWMAEQVGRKEIAIHSKMIISIIIILWIELKYVLDLLLYFDIVTLHDS